MIELDVFFHSDESYALKSCGVDYSLDSCDTRKMTFYQINAISPYLEDGQEYSSIHTNGAEYIATIKYGELKKMLNR